MVAGLTDTLMAKTKAKNSDETNPDERVSILVYKGKRAYRDWLADSARSKRLPLTVLLDVALLEYAERHGLPLPPER